MIRPPTGTPGLVLQGLLQAPQAPGSGFVPPSHHQLEKQRKWVTSGALCAPEVWMASMLGGSASPTESLTIRQDPRFESLPGAGYAQPFCQSGPPCLTTGLRTPKQPNPNSSPEKPTCFA